MRNLKWIIAFASVVFLGISENSMAEPCIGKISNAKIESYSERPSAGSGYILSWMHLKVSEPHDFEDDLYLIYSGSEDVFPEEGAKCSIEYHIGDVMGVVGRAHAKAQHDAKIVGRILCGHDLFEQRGAEAWKRYPS